MITIYAILTYVAGCATIILFLQDGELSRATISLLFSGIFYAKWRILILEEKLKAIERRLGIHHE
jgi:hypothetical protein